MNKTNAMRVLERAGVPFIAHEYDTARGVDALSVAATLGMPPDRIFKTLVVISPMREHFVFVVPATGELDLKKAARAAGVKSLEMLPQKSLLSTTGYVHGGCSPVGMKKAFPTFFDVSARAQATCCVSGGKIGLTLEVNADRLAAFISARFADLIAAHATP